MNRLSMHVRLAACALLPVLAMAPAESGASQSTYVLGVPCAPRIRNVTDAALNEWLVANASFAPMSSSVAASAVSRPDVAGAKTAVLTSSEAGFAIERTKPEYYLGDRISPPDGVDWTKTYDRYLAEKPKGVLFDPVDRRVFVTEGGTIGVTWVLEDGSVDERTYVVSVSCSGRPRRIYWTDAPYNGPGIDLSGKFVKLFGSPEIVTPRYATVTNTTAGVQQVIENKIVSGLVIDTASHMLFAHGELQGQVVIAYYDSGTYERILHVQAVEVCRPVVNVLSGEIGRPLKPDGRGHATEGLRARPTVVSPTDDRGEYLYQHKGMYSYSPKNGSVFPLRPTKDCRWNAEIYWMETDEMEVEWPFEVDHYECDWPADAAVFVRGDKDGDFGRAIFVPGDYVPALMSYQEPEGHARAPLADGTFETTGEGFSLLRLTAEDNIWFVPVRSVLRSNKKCFTLRAEEVSVGSELRLRSGASAGTAEGFAPKCDASSPGYIYRAASDRVWNPGLYTEPAASVAGGVSTNILSSVSGDTNTYESVIYAVTAKKPGGSVAGAGPVLEVWWNTTIQEEDMPVPLEVPTLPQVYSVRWPRRLENPEIAIASQLGSASLSIYYHGSALRLETDDSSAALAERNYFSADGGTLMFWVRCPEASADAAGAVLSVFAEARDAGQPAFIVADVRRSAGAAELCLKYGAGAEEADEVLALPDDGMWHHVAVVLSPGGGLERYLDGESLGERAGLPDLSGLLGASLNACIGASGVGGAAKACPGADIGELLFWGRALAAEDVANECFRTHDGTENALAGCYSFRDGLDLLPSGNESRLFMEKVLDTSHTAFRCICVGYGPPAIGDGGVDADAGTVPEVYVQNDPDGVGYNPNEEHAFSTGAADGYAVWALRADLNTDSSSPPGILLEYVKNGRKSMRWFDVCVTNSFYRELGGECFAGEMLPGPHPLDLLENPWCPQTYWDEPSSLTPAHRDRKGQLWARGAGDLNVRMFYPMQDGFAFPSLPHAEWPKTGEGVPWLSLLGESPEDKGALSRAPAAWHWRVKWPENVPEIEIGRTLTVAASGLPEVWNAKSVGVVWPATEEERDATVVLFDPTAVQSSGFPKELYSSVAEAVADLGIRQGAGGNATLRNGKWTFDGLPPAVSARFYVDTTADVTNCIKFAGEQESGLSGVSVLHVNVLGRSERASLETLFDETASAAGRSAWKDAIRQLAAKCVKPSVHRSVSASEDAIDYAPRDHYALFTMGATNYVTLIENDSTNSLMNVEDGDPIQMHLMKVVPKYHVGRVVVREDPLNSLSQQLSVIYSESFAGDAGRYVFEWRAAAPRHDGTVPTDYEGEYVQKISPESGLVHFTVGHQGDTLANMVNTYYAVRYRAADSNSPAYAVMGERWSEWTDPPALAEGWVQRVLNNVTPFAQRMGDLVENGAETAVTMMQQAGAPYEGDVALNQDNLASVGLIQLYETILNKAESMSLQMGLDDPEANKQLQLAVTRLADLYSVLGDEAYTDAINPTIGFGSSFNSSQGWFTSGYGALSSAMFAFDNQVPTLLDEELALLRGRSGENAPSTRISPYYNRLVWNVSKSPVGGEVAYMMNYNISGNNTGVLDENTAAAMYPQGHGDAYGHYLSALSGYYRLLRNPYFTWGAPAMGEMVVADSVLNVDYYDEAQFAKAAFNVAKTALEAVDRTARKAYRDESAAAGAGYLDLDASRNFGYGEWASRGGFGALCNWAVGNSLLKAQPKNGDYMRHLFDASGSMSAWIPEESKAKLAADGSWTVEFQLLPETQQSPGAVPLMLSDGSVMVDVALDENLTLTVGKTAMETKTESYSCQVLCFVKDGAGSGESDPYFEFAVTNGYDVYEYGFFGDDAPRALPDGFEPGSGRYPSWPGWRCSSVSDDGEIVPYEYSHAVEYSRPAGDRAFEEICRLPEGMGVLVSIRSLNGVQTLSVFDVLRGLKIAEKELSLAVGLAPDTVVVGTEYAGEIGELRIWDGVVRTDAELLAKRDYASPNSDGLQLYMRPISTSDRSVLADDADFGIVWHIDGGSWIPACESGMSIGFEDEGLKRIDRSTVAELSSLADIVPQIQKKVDQMDAGLNPLGLASGAIPFDLTPIGLADGTRSHFEQIRERALVALDNARKSLDNAQEFASRLRLIQEGQGAKEDELETMELETKNKLTEYFGYPYEVDIGPGGTYPEGYDGPDIYHYAWMEPELYGLFEEADSASVTLTTKSKPGTYSVYIPFLPSSSTEKEVELKFQLSSSGFVLKPSEISGKRRAQGKIQDALADFIAAYVTFKSKSSICKSRLADFETSIWTAANFTTPIAEAKFVAEEFGVVSGYLAAGTKTSLKCSINTLEMMAKLDESTQEAILSSIPGIQGAGLTVNIDPKALASAAIIAPDLATGTARETSLLAAKNALVAMESSKSFTDLAKSMLLSLADLVQSRSALYETLRSAWYTYNSSKTDMVNAYQALQAAQSRVESIIAEVEGIIDERTLARVQAVDSITKQRYSDMFFRLARNNALSRYSAQFDLAQKYAYLAAQAYDYETGLLSSDPKSGDAFIARIVGARTLGEFDAEGKPTVASDAVKGDGGLAAILAEMSENWLVLKPRLGINNPQPYATWFSLRHDLFRIYGGEDGEKSWRKELRKYMVDDLNAIAEFRHYCQPLSGSKEKKEPGLVIPFQSFIGHGYNFFGEELAGGDSALDSTYFATHIAAAGVHFEGFDDTVLAKTPVAYLVPVGEDRMCAAGDPETVLSWKVVDQTIPAPYAIGSAHLNDPDWTPLFDGATGGNDIGARIRRHPSFRAYYGKEGEAPSDSSLDCTRLVGRSAWNTRWLLVIPAGSLGSDREAALGAFVNGVDSNRDGKLDFKGVRDIKIGLRTYSTSGN